MQSLKTQESNVTQAHFHLGKLRLVYQLIAILLVVFAWLVMPTSIDIVPLVVVVFSYVAFSWGVGQKATVQNDRGLMGLTLVDLSIFGALVYYTGGASNGMITILLLPVAVAAASLSMLSASLLAAYASTIYSVLTWQFLSPSMQHSVHNNLHTDSGFNSHLVAMWVTFVMSCIIVVWFVGKQSQLVREKQKSLAKLREQQLRNEQLVSIATFAANAAHDLATPLSSIRLINDELIEEYEQPEFDETSGDINTLLITQQQQLVRCQKILSELSLKALQSKSGHQKNEKINDYLPPLIQRWLVSRPEIVVKQSLCADNAKVVTDASLDAAITNILDNAAQASIANNHFELSVTGIVENNVFELHIQDYGTGISNELLTRLGKEPVQSVKEGMGLGQFLANASIERAGGHVWRMNNPNGCLTKILLPISQSRNSSDV